MRIYGDDDQVFISELPNTKNIKIPSAMYPLNGNPKVFYEKNTTVIRPLALDIIDSIPYRIGRCYTNADAVAKALQSVGINAIEYVGWCFYQDTAPLHHAFVVVDDNGIIDLSMDAHMESVEKETAHLVNESSMSAREALARVYKERMKLRNSERCICGAVPNYVIYVGSPCSASQGIKIYNKLIKAYPKHPCNRTLNGMPNETQQIMLNVLEKK